MVGNQPGEASSNRLNDGRAATWLGLEWGGEPYRWRMEAVDGVTGGSGRLFGGCGAAAAIIAAEEATGRPVVWLSVRVTGGHGATTFLHANAAAVGGRASSEQQDWFAVPCVPDAQECPLADFPADEGSLRDRVECRRVDDETANRSGRSSWWMRLRDGTLWVHSLAAVAFDFVPLGLAAVIGRPLFAASFDNTVRLVERTTTEWLLVNMTVAALRQNVAHVTGNAWASDGTLVAIGSQSCMVSPR